MKINRTENGSLVGNITGKNTTKTIQNILRNGEVLKLFKKTHYSSTEEYLLHRIAELEDEVKMYKEYIAQIQWQPIINPVTNKVVGYKTDKSLEEVCKEEM